MQFLLSIMLPLQCFPPFLGGGAWHSRLRQWVHSVPQADHLAHSVQPPSTEIFEKENGFAWISPARFTTIPGRLAVNCGALISKL